MAVCLQNRHKTSNNMAIKVAVRVSRDHGRGFPPYYRSHAKGFPAHCIGCSPTPHIVYANVIDFRRVSFCSCRFPY